MKRARSVLVGCACAVTGALAPACGKLLDADAYHVDATSEAGQAARGGDASTALPAAPEAGCDDPAGFSGRGCFACAPTNREERQNACTASACAPFDEARIADRLVDGHVPSLPPEGAPEALAIGEARALSADASAPTDAGTGPAPDAGPVNPRCAALPEPVYATGSSAVKPFLARIAQAIGAQRTVVYVPSGSCVGVDAIVNGAPMTGSGATAASYWDPATSDPASAERRCDLDAGGVQADVGVSDVFATTCLDLPQGLPAGVGDFYGPVQVMSFVVPSSSSQRTISADAAYLVFGFGDASGVAPWTDARFLFQRTATSGTQAMIGAEIGVAPGRWRGTPSKTSDDVQAKLASVSAEDADRTLAILSADIADDFRGQERALAYQARGQRCGFWPDSAEGKFDRRNVRDGHYPIWGPLHLLAHVGGDGAPIGASVAALVGYLSGSRALPGGLDLVALYAERHVVPLCAMRVTRTSDGGPLASYAPSSPCGCAFENDATGSTDCAPCATSADCAASAPTCSHGYCER
jgi:hypothetical protein